MPIAPPRRAWTADDAESLPDNARIAEITGTGTVELLGVTVELDVSGLLA